MIIQVKELIKIEKFVKLIKINKSVKLLKVAVFIKLVHLEKLKMKKID